MLYSPPYPCKAPLYFYPRDTTVYASVGLCDSNVSVRHAPVLRQNEQSVMISSLSGSPMILVF